MDTTHYIWIYGLAEALAVTGVLAVVFGVKWWKLRGKQAALGATSERIARLVASKVESIKNAPAPWRALQETQTAALTALASPFRDRQIADEAAWEKSLQKLEHCFEALALTTGEYVAAKSTTAGLGQRQDADGDAIPAIGPNHSSHASLTASQEAANDLDAKLLAVHNAHQRLRSKLLEHAKQDAVAHLLGELDQVEQRNRELMQAAAIAKRNFKLVARDCEEIQDQVQQLKSTIQHDRSTVHQLTTERDSLAAEMQKQVKMLAEQKTAIEEQKAVIEMMKRKHNALLREYGNLYGVIQ